MEIEHIIQLAGAIVSILVIGNEILKQIREWRGGSPELRLLRTTVESLNKDHTGLLEKILAKLP
jgi:hypothetical protein